MCRSLMTHIHRKRYINTSHWVHVIGLYITILISVVTEENKCAGVAVGGHGMLPIASAMRTQLHCCFLQTICPGYDAKARLKLVQAHCRNASKTTLRKASNSRHLYGVVTIAIIPYTNKVLLIKYLLSYIEYNLVT